MFSNLNFEELYPQLANRIPVRVDGRVKDLSDFAPSPPERQSDKPNRKLELVKTGSEAHFYVEGALTGTVINTMHRENATAWNVIAQGAPNWKDALLNNPDQHFHVVPVAPILSRDSGEGLRSQMHPRENKAHVFSRFCGLSVETFFNKKLPESNHLTKMRAMLEDRIYKNLHNLRLSGFDHGHQDLRGNHTVEFIRRNYLIANLQAGHTINTLLFDENEMSFSPEDWFDNRSDESPDSITASSETNAENPFIMVVRSIDLDSTALRLHDHDLRDVSVDQIYSNSIRLLSATDDYSQLLGLALARHVHEWTNDLFELVWANFDAGNMIEKAGEALAENKTWPDSFWQKVSFYLESPLFAETMVETLKKKKNKEQDQLPENVWQILKTFLTGSDKNKQLLAATVVASQPSASEDMQELLTKFFASYEDRWVLIDNYINPEEQVGGVSYNTAPLYYFSAFSSMAKECLRRTIPNRK